MEYWPSHKVLRTFPPSFYGNNRGCIGLQLTTAQNREMAFLMSSDGVYLEPEYDCHVFPSLRYSEAMSDSEQRCII